MSQRLEDLLPSFESIENLSLIMDYFWSAIEEFLSLGLLDDVNDFNDFVVAILKNIEEILMIYPNFEGSLSNLALKLLTNKLYIKDSSERLCSFVLQYRKSFE